MSTERAATEGMPFGRYVLKERLAQGGMGEVFRAVAMGASGFEKPVVVKRLLPQLSGQRIVAEMFVTEAKVLSRLAHPNIVQVIDFGEGQEEDYFLVLELVEGVDLGQFRRAFERRGELVPLPLVLYVGSQILRGLGHAHERAYDDGRTIVHRDVSPGNVLLSAVGEVKVADFGVVHVAAPGDEGGAPGRVVGKPGYMAPEQLTGDAVDPRADLFAVGAVLFELATHHLPAEAARARRPGEPRALPGTLPASALRPDIPPELDEVLRQALCILPEQRFPTARAMARAVEKVRQALPPLATADDLALAVETAQQELVRPARPVLLLGADPEAERELTRVGPDEPFTLRLAARAAARPGAREAGRVEAGGAAGRAAGRAPRTGASGAPDPTDLRARVGHAATHRRGTWLLGAGLVGLAAGGLWWASGSEIPRDGRTTTVAEAGALASPVPAAAPSAPPSSPEMEEAARSTPAEPSATPVADPSAASAARPTAHAATGRSTAPADRATTGATATALTASPPCEGEVHLYADHGWVVRGGPRVVQAPGRYRWACGSYGLEATSRLDPSEVRRRSLTVQADRTSVVDLRP